VTARFSASVQTVPEAQTASCTMGTRGSFLGINRLGMALTTPHHIGSRLKKEYSYASTPPLGLRDKLQGEL